MVKERQPTEKSEKRIRVQFDMSPDLLNRLDNLKINLDVPTRPEVVRNAIRVYSYFVEKARRGEEINIKNTDLKAILGLPMNDKS